MKPGEHPEFYRLPPPPGRSRESTIVLDEQGRFFHDSEPVEHDGMARAFARWIRRHPDNGRFILSNDYDWCYFAVSATPIFVTAAQPCDDEVELTLFDQTRELLDVASLWVDASGRLRCKVKQGSYEALFGQRAQLQLEPLLVAGEPPSLLLAGVLHPLLDHPPA